MGLLNLAGCVCGGMWGIGTLSLVGQGLGLSYGDTEPNWGRDGDMGSGMLTLARPGMGMERWGC